MSFAGLSSTHTTMGDPARNSGAAWISRFLFIRLSYYFLHKYPQRLLWAMPEQQDREATPQAGGRVPGPPACLHTFQHVAGRPGAQGASSFLPSYALLCLERNRVQTAIGRETWRVLGAPRPPSRPTCPVVLRTARTGRQSGPGP